MAKKQNTAEYGNNSIVALKGADRVRKRPAVIFGSDGLEGCEHSFFEILSNAVDEAREGYGNVINVTVFRDGSYEVADEGRGIPLGYNEREGRYNWELVFCEMYAGGKYNNNDENSNYGFSLGLNGLGACATQYSSEYMSVRSYNGKTLSQINFKKGEPASGLEVSELSKKEARTGTVIRWKPDIEVFTDVDIPRDFFTELLNKQSIVNAGIKFILKFENENGGFDESEYCYENGISDYIKDIVGDSSITEPVLWKLETSGRDREDQSDYKLKAEFTFAFSNVGSRIEYYHNSSFLSHGGSPDRAVRTAFAFAIDKYLKTMKAYKAKEEKITFADIEESLVMIVSSFSTQTSYENQTKKAITNKFIATAMTDFLKHNLEVYFAENPTEAEKIAAQVLLNKRSRESAESTRLSIKKKLSGNIDIANRVEKFVNCRSRDPELRELYIVEGDSAASSCKLGRDAEFQAIMPVRGKTLNCLKSSYEKIFKSDVITDLLRVIGCGVEFTTKVKSDLPPFDIGALRWSKIIICTDADEDGYQIRALLLTLFYRLLPTLIKEGKIYIAESPLFEITCRDKIEFAYNEQEKLEITARLGDAPYSLQRSKGLGENESDMMWQTTMNPESRRLIRVGEADAEETREIFDILLGDNLQGRKNYIAEHGAEYIAMATD